MSGGAPLETKASGPPAAVQVIPQKQQQQALGNSQPPARAVRLDNKMDSSWEDIPTIVDVKLPWYKPTDSCQVSTIAEGNCLFHGVLKATSDTYRNAKKVAERIKIARDWRTELASNMSKNWDAYDAILGFVQKGWDKKELLAQIDSYKHVGDEALYIIAVQARVNLHIVEKLSDGSFRPSASIPVVDCARHIIIVQVSDHYELIIRKVAKGYQTWFPADDPIITGLSAFRKGAM